DGHVWIEWLHRTVAAIIGLLTLAMAVVAFRDHRDRRSILGPSIGAVVLVGFQAWLGQETVRLGNTGGSVTAHLATAMPLVAVLAFYAVQVVVGGLQVLTNLAPWTQTLHVAFGALIWGGTAGLAIWSFYEARSEAALASGPAGSQTSGPRTLRDTVTAYVALT